MEPIYRIILLGSESHFSGDIRQSVEDQLKEFDLSIGDEVELIRNSDQVDQRNHVATVVLFFGDDPSPPYSLPSHIQPHHPVIPIVSSLDRCSLELPCQISHWNAMGRAGQSAPNAIASAVLECLGLMPARRRLFLSYRRVESRDVALQLFDELSARQFDVFLDTHEVRPGAVFQDVLWHSLCECDVMVMLDTAQYFASRWTREEFGKANLKKAAILRVGWPDVSRDENLSVTESSDLNASDFDVDGRLLAASIERISDAVERLRSKSISVRQANLVGSLRAAVDQMNGRVDEPGPMRRVVASFPGGKSLTVYPTVGVPTSEVLNKIADDAEGKDYALLYDHAGVLGRWLEHLDWLGGGLDGFRWIRSAAVADALTDFQGP